MSNEFPRALIIGGGFSGSALAIQLAARGVASVIVEARGRVARGAAYSTTHEEHLLNVPAGKMGLTPDDPHAFAAHVEEDGAGPQDFVSRRRFGDYVEAELERAAAGGHVEIVRDRAVAARPGGRGWIVELESGGRIEGEALVLANGNQPPAGLAIDGIAAARIVEDPWSDEGRARIADLAKGKAPVLLVGTGLTMVDVVLTLEQAGFEGHVTALSRRGQVPRAHVEGVTPLAASLDEVPERLSDALRWMRRRAQGGDWRAAVDGLRPVTQAIWARLGPDGQARFLRHLRPWWDVHRHRIAPQAADVIDRLRGEGRLEIVAGRIVRGAETAEGARIEVARRGGGSGMIEAETVINCTGPLSRIDQSGDALVRQMLADRLAQADALAMGLAVDAQDRVEGSRGAWAIGPMTKGRYWEITAVPDIRVQAERIAEDIARCLIRATV